MEQNKENFPTKDDRLKLLQEQLLLAKKEELRKLKLSIIPDETKIQEVEKAIEGIKKDLCHDIH